MEDDKNDAANVVQPGQTVTPSAAPQTPSEPAAPTPAPAEPTPETPAEPAAPTPDPAPPAEEPQFDAQPEDMAAPDGSDEQPISWTASEFIAHAKSAGWYFLLALAAVGVAAVVYVLTRDVISSGVIIVAATFLGFYAGHKPRELEYRLDTSGLSIGQKHFSYNQFRSFSVLPEGAFSSIVFMPLKRFAVPTTIYYSPEDEDRIVNILGSRLPMEQRGHDAIDRLMHRIHF